MGIGTESALPTQVKKAQGKTNERLDVLIARRRRTNAEWLGGVLNQAAQHP
jgi:hypothetical protein